MALMFALLLFLLGLVAAAPPNGHFEPCAPRECGPMPMLMLRCVDGTSAGYTCQRNATTGVCALVSPHCPNDNHTHRPIIRHGPYPVASHPYNHTAANSSAVDTAASTVLYTSQQPTFNCSRLQCGPSIMPVLRTCPGGEHAYPLCAWVSELQRCGYLDPSCSYPGWRDHDFAVDESADVGLSAAEMAVQGTARERCERGGCMLPMYIRLCADGSTVRPRCVWSSSNGT